MDEARPGRGQVLSAQPGVTGAAIESRWAVTPTPARLAGLLASVLGAALLWAWWHSVFSLPLNADAGYYLSSAARVREGWRPYLDFALSYPPVGIWFFAGVQALFGPGAEAVRLALLALSLANAAALSFLPGLAARPRTWRALVAALYLLLALGYEADAVVLEGLVTLFALLATIAVARPGLPAAGLGGLCFALACLAKPFGLGVLPGIGWFLVRGSAGPRDLSRRLALFALGAAGILVGVLLLLGPGPDAFLTSIGGKGYGAKGFGEMLGSLCGPRGLWFCLTLLVAGAWLRRAPRLVGLWLLVIIELAPLYVRTWPHYYLLALPFGVALLAELACEAPAAGQATGLRSRLIAAGLVLALAPPAALALQTPLVYSLPAALRSGAERLWPAMGPRLHRETRAETEARAAAINQVLPRGSPVLVLNQPVYAWLCGFLPPDPGLGYAFVHVDDLQGLAGEPPQHLLWVGGPGLPYRIFARHARRHHRLVATLPARRDPTALAAGALCRRERSRDRPRDSDPRGTSSCPREDGVSPSPTAGGGVSGEATEVWSRSPLLGPSAAAGAVPSSPPSPTSSGAPPGWGKAPAN
jgi:hypothetical protein